MEVVYLLSEFIFAFMWLRVLFLVRAIFNYSVFTDAYSKKLCHTYGFTAGVRFAFKCQMIVDPEKTVFMLFTSTILIFSQLLRIFELPYCRIDDDIAMKNIMDQYFNAVWCTIITITTVGYGDISPSTTPGRVVAVSIALVGTFLISIVVVTVSSIFELTPNQKMALGHIRLTRRAAVTISKGIKFYLTKKRYFITYEMKGKKVSRGTIDSEFLALLRENPRSRESMPKQDNSAINRSTISDGEISSHTLSGVTSRRGYGDYQEDDELRGVEADLKLARSDMLNQLDEFKMERNILRKMQAERNMEQKMSTRFIKHEVAEINDKVEWMQERIVAQQHMLATILRRLDGGEYGDEGEGGSGSGSEGSNDGDGHSHGGHAGHHHHGHNSDSSFGTDQEDEDGDGGSDDGKEGRQQTGKGGGAPKQHAMNIGD